MSALRQKRPFTQSPYLYGQTIKNLYGQTIKKTKATRAFGAVREVVGIGRGAFSGNMKVSFQAARSIG